MLRRILSTRLKTLAAASSSSFTPRSASSAARFAALSRSSSYFSTQFEDATAIKKKLNGLFYCKRYSTSVSNDSDTHDDFKPANKLEGSDISLINVIEQDVKDNPVMVYMKGVPDLPQCGFSSLAVRVLKHYDVPISARNILEDAELKNAVKAFSNWPTFPQVFIKGEFIGGSDIVLNMHQTGELKEKLKDIPSKK